MKNSYLVVPTMLVAACSQGRNSERASNDIAFRGAVETGAQSAPPRGTVGWNTAERTELVARLDALDAAIEKWRKAPNLGAARASAEQARNLITGSAGPGYGDLNGDGTIADQVNIGLLPGAAGQAGLASDRPNPCMKADVLGGDFSDAAARWATMDRAIADWRSNKNTFPALPSHPQRIVGWATLTLNRANLTQAHEYARHAKMHADKTRAAITACKS